MSVFAEPVMTEQDGRRVSRLRADELDELHEFVAAACLDVGAFVAHKVSGRRSYYELSPRQRKTAVRAGATDLDWRGTLQWVRATVVEDARRDTRELLSQPRFGLRRPLGADALDAMPADDGPLPALGHKVPGFDGGTSRRTVSAFTLSKTGWRSIQLTPRRPARDRYHETCEFVSLSPGD